MTSSISIRTNRAALTAQRSLQANSRALESCYTRLSSGLRINRPSDDPAGLAVSAAIGTDVRVLGQGIRNLNDGISLTNIAESALASLSGIVERLEELAVQASNGTLTSSQARALDREAQGLSSEYSRVIKYTKFNERSLLDGSLGELRLQLSYGAEGAIAAGLGGAIGTGSFGGPVSYATQSRMLYAAALADLNGDGFGDLVTAGMTDGGAGYLTAMLGRGDGSFSPGASYATEGHASYAIALEDINRDGVIDLVTAGDASSNGYATVRLGTGTGSFGAARSYAVEARASLGVALKDLNGDGIADLATAGMDDANNGYATVRLGAGDGTFGAARSYTTESRTSWGMTLGDLNSDGILDLVTGGSTDANDGYATVRLGVGNGTFGAATSYVTESYGSNAVALGDLNGDGKLDLVTAGGSDAGDGWTTVRLGLGNGSFGAAASYLTESGVSYALKLGDLNGDGTLDLVTAGAADSDYGYATVRLGSPNGTFGAPASYATESYGSNAVALGDLNVDGVLDLITAGWKDVAFDGYATVRLSVVKDGTSPLLPFDLCTTASARQALPMFEQKRAQLASQRGQIGAFHSRLGSALGVLNASRDNHLTARSRITDADIAEESALLVKQQILQQAGTAVLAQAKLQPHIALTLLRLPG